jgi:hypothetical protein
LFIAGAGAPIAGLQVRSRTLMPMARQRLRARVNWAVRWGGMLVCVAVVAAYIATWNRSVSVLTYSRTGYGGLILIRGSLAATKTGSLGRGSPWLFVRSPLDARPHWRWVLVPDIRTGRTTTVSLPLWIIFATSLSVTIAAHARRKRFRPESECPSCHYDLSGLPPGSPCPECAATPTPPKVSPL